MDISIFKKSDPTGRMSRESFLLRNYKDEYNYIVDFCTSNNLLDLPFKEKVYLSVNKIYKIPVCKNTNCNCLVKFKNSTIGYLSYCSNKCISSDPEIKKIKKEKSLEKYGTKTPSESTYIKAKIIKTNQIKYGGNSPMCNIDIQLKYKETLLSNFGVDNPSKSSYLTSKRIKSFMLSDFKETYKNTSIRKYSVEHPWMNKEIYNKSILSTKVVKNNNLLVRMSDKLTSYNQYTLIDIDYDKFKRNIKVYCSDCVSIFEINREDFHLRHIGKTTICTNCNPIDSCTSGTELQLYKYISEIYNGIIILNSKSIISPYEIDIYLPDINMAFEYNGLYWHSEEKKGKFYHDKKTNLCNSLGISLMHIWEDDWVYKNDIVKSILLNKISKNKIRIFARSCKIHKVSINTQSEFLKKNHIFGYVGSSIKLGLFFNDEIVSLMCFVKVGDVYELSRFCNKINTSVIGGASKLFNFFINNYNPKKVISYSDNSMYSGELYNKLGFFIESESAINYKWVLQKRRVHKSNYRKSRLVKLGYDINKNEDNIMIEDVGSYKVWDCGLKKWAWTTKPK
jgi:hypothetical protein